MKLVLITMLAALALLGIVFALWVSVHMWAALRLGLRKLGCKGPTYDQRGNAICCHTGDLCDGSGGSRRTVGQLPKMER